MRSDKIIHTRFYHQKTEHWKDMDELHEVLHSLPNYFKALTFELLEKPMSRQGLLESLRHIEMRMGRHHRRGFKKIDLDKDIASVIERGVLEEKAAWWAAGCYAGLALKAAPQNQLHPPKNCRKILQCNAINHVESRNAAMQCDTYAKYRRCQGRRTSHSSFNG